MEEKVFYCEDSRIRECVIPEGYTRIGNRAFSGCANLKSVVIPKSVETIGMRAFLSCYELTSITIPESVKTIEPEAFRNCFALTSIEIPNSVIHIGAHSFSGCRMLKSVVIGSSVITIDDYAFLDCYKISNITIPNSVMYIGHGAFGNCHMLEDRPCVGDCYKGMRKCDRGLFCHGFEYEVDKSYHEDNIRCCQHGFHACVDILDVFNYYYGEYGRNFVICKVEVSGQIATDYLSTDSKICTSDIKVIRQLSREEVIDAINESFKNYNKEKNEG